MWEFFSKVVETLPPWFVMALIVFLLGAAAYALPRLRRDKDGKFYLFSRSYEHQKNRSKGLGEAVCRVTEDVKAVSRRVAGIELEGLKQSFYLAPLPKDERLIAGLKFVRRGGNGAVRKDVADFVRENPDVYADVIARYPQWAVGQGTESSGAGA
jgi:hypothetical protein